MLSSESVKCNIYCLGLLFYHQEHQLYDYLEPCIAVSSLIIPWTSDVHCPEQLKGDITAIIGTTNVELESCSIVPLGRKEVASRRPRRLRSKSLGFPVYPVAMCSYFDDTRLNGWLEEVIKPKMGFLHGDPRSRTHGRMNSHDNRSEGGYDAPLSVLKIGPNKPAHIHHTPQARSVFSKLFSYVRNAMSFNPSALLGYDRMNSWQG